MARRVKYIETTSKTLSLRGTMSQDGQSITCEDDFGELVHYGLASWLGNAFGGKAVEISVTTKETKDLMDGLDDGDGN